MSDEHAKLVIPGLLQQGAQNLKDHDPLVFKRLSWQHIDILTAPCRDRIKELEAKVARLRQVETTAMSLMSLESNITLEKRMREYDDMGISDE